MNRKRQASESDDAQASTSAKAGAVKQKDKKKKNRNKKKKNRNKKKRQDQDKGFVIAGVNKSHTLKTELTHGTVDLLRVLFYGGTTQLSSTKNSFRRP